MEKFTVDDLLFNAIKLVSSLSSSFGLSLVSSFSPVERACASRDGEMSAMLAFSHASSTVCIAPTRHLHARRDTRNNCTDLCSVDALPHNSPAFGVQYCSCSPHAPTVVNTLEDIDPLDNQAFVVQDQANNFSFISAAQ